MPAGTRRRCPSPRTDATRSSGASTRPRLAGPPLRRRPCRRVRPRRHPRPLPPRRRRGRRPPHRPRHRRLRRRRHRLRRRRDARRVHRSRDHDSRRPACWGQPFEGLLRLARPHDYNEGLLPLTVDSTPMIRSWKDMAALAAVIVLSVVSAVGLTRLGPPPAADVARGSEEAFGRGLQRRELPPGAGPQRWTTAHAAFTFRDLPRTSATLTVEIRDARGPVTVVADGVVVGRLDPAVRAGAFPLAPTGRRTREVELWSEPFRAGDGRLLGALLGRVAIATAERDSWPPPAILLELLLPALVALASSRLAGLRPASALAVALVTIALATAALWPSGLAHSPYGPRLGALSCAGSVLALAFARSVATRHPAAAAAAFVALTAGWWVQVVAATSPVMVVSDVVFHANKLAAVSAGELFPVSVTQHARPFRFPYGVSFYAVLAPLARAGLDAVELVRVGAAAARLAATAAVFLLALSAIRPRAAALAAVLLQVLPGAFDVAYSYGNLSNAFGQSATVLFFCWWAE